MLLISSRELARSSLWWRTSLMWSVQRHQLYIDSTAVWYSYRRASCRLELLGSLSQGRLSQIPASRILFLPVHFRLRLYTSFLQSRCYTWDQYSLLYEG